MNMSFAYLTGTCIHRYRDELGTITRITTIDK